MLFGVNLGWYFFVTYLDKTRVFRNKAESILALGSVCVDVYAFHVVKREGGGIETLFFDFLRKYIV